MSEISEQIMTTPTHHHLSSDESSIAGPSVTTIYANLVVSLSSSDKDEATSIPQKLDNRAYPEKRLCLVDGHDDNDDDEDDNNYVDGNADHKHGDGGTDWGSGDVMVEGEGRKLEDSNGLEQCSYAASLTLNYIHGMEESSRSAPGNKMDRTGVEKVWSNEKHNAYLNSMEANFMRDMYAQYDDFSLELCKNQSHSQSESESESEARVVYTGTSFYSMDEMMMISEECMEGSISSSSSSLRRKCGIYYINNAKKEKGSSHSHSHAHATTTTTTKSTSRTRNEKMKRTAFPSFGNSGPSDWQNIVQYSLPDIDIARLHKHATTLNNPIQYSNPTIYSNVKKRACLVLSCEEERSMKTMKLLQKKCPFLSSYYDQVVPSPCINSIGSHQDSQDMQGFAKITKVSAIGLESTTKPLS